MYMWAILDAPPSLVWIDVALYHKTSILVLFRSVA